MNNVNWWLMALAFLLGLLLTFATMIRRVQREVPIHRATARLVNGQAGADAHTTEIPVAEGDSPSRLAGPVGGSTATAEMPAAQHDLTTTSEEKPYGAGEAADTSTAKTPAAPGEQYGVGSVRVAAGATAPEDYTIRGDEKSMRYYTADSLSYRDTTSGIWFRDEESAMRAGFIRWDRTDTDVDSTSRLAARVEGRGDAVERGDGVDWTDKLAAGAAAAGAAVTGAASKLFRSDDETPAEQPHGPGSLRVAAGVSAPAGYTIKGNEDSMLYYTPDSPAYNQAIAGIWFKDEQSALRGGFMRWDKGGVGDLRASGSTADAESTSKFAGAGADAARAAGGATAANIAGRESVDAPYGPGSLRVAAGGASAPAGYTVKGNEDSMLYHTPDSPSYKQTIAEVWFRDEESAVHGGFSRWDKGKPADGAAKFADIPPGPYGRGSAKPTADGSGPAGWTVKGNEDSMLYHTPASPSYRQTIAEVWFKDEESAVQAGFTPWHKGRAKK
jgi:hypothetical protein